MWTVRASLEQGVLTVGMSGVASAFASAQPHPKAPDTIHAHMLTEEKGHDRSIPLLGCPLLTLCHF